MIATGDIPGRVIRLGKHGKALEYIIGVEN